MQSGARPPCLSPWLRPTAAAQSRTVEKDAGDEGREGTGVAPQKDRIQVPDRDAIMNGDLAGAVAGNAGDQAPDVEEFAVDIDAELPVAGADEAGMAVNAAECEQGKAREPNGPGQNDMRTRRHDLS